MEELLTLLAGRLRPGPWLYPADQVSDLPMRQLAAEIVRHGTAVEDAAWRLPLWQDYRAMIEGDVGEISTRGSGPGAGAITAALFLESFVDKDIPWAHFDIMAWNSSARPGRPKGGEVMGARALFAMLEDRYGA